MFISALIITKIFEVNKNYIIKIYLTVSSFVSMCIVLQLLQLKIAGMFAY